MKPWLVFLGAAIFAVLISCAGSGTVTPTGSTDTVTEEVEPAPVRPATVQAFNPALNVTNVGWWANSVFYLAFVRSFQDSNGDGKGDLQGLIKRLDYLNDGNPSTTTDLGITGLWLMPIHPSPNNHGYDVKDFYGINPEYGTMDDYKTLISEAKKRGIKVILDLVLNHTSNQHPFFLEASTNASSPRRDFYIWSDRVLHTRGPWGQTTIWHNTPTGYYYGVFNFLMPDLNHKNPAVTQEMRNVARFWLRDVGVDGFRLDAIKYLIENGNRLADSPENVEYLRGFRSYVRSVSPQSYLIGEVWSGTEITAAYVPNSVDSVFSFDTQGAIIGSLKNGIKDELEYAFDQVQQHLPLGTAALFLSNHDMDRVMSQLGADWEKAKAAALILMTGPGTPYIYYGEEIGTQGAKGGGGDDNWRRAMQWGDGPEPGLGFSDRRPWGMGFNQPGKENTVAAQTSDPTSLLSWYRDLIRLRSQASALRTGKLIPVETNSQSIFSYVRWDTTGTYLVLINLAEVPSSLYGLTLWSGPLKTGASVVQAAGTKIEGSLNNPEVNADGGFDFWRPVSTLPPEAALVLKIQ